MKEILVQERRARGSSTGARPGPAGTRTRREPHGWWVGSVEREGSLVLYAARIEGPGASGMVCRPMAEKALVALGVLPARVEAGGMTMQRPTETEYAPFYARYLALVPESDILAVLEPQVEEIRRLLAPVSAEREAYRYAEGKWSIRQVLGHLVDGERIFGYRAFCFSRGEQAALPSFDENHYVAAARSDSIPLRELVDELALVRQSNLAVLRRLDAREWAAGRDRERQAGVGPRPRLGDGRPPAAPRPGPAREVRRLLSLFVVRCRRAVAV